MRLIYKLTIPIMLILGLLSLVIAIFFSTSLQNAMIQQEVLQVEDAVTKGEAQFITATDIANPGSVASQADFQSFFNTVTNPSIARFTIWSTDRTVIFSDLPKIIGAHAEDNAEVGQVVVTGAPFSSVEVNDTGSPQQTAISNFIDIFIPLKVDGHVVAVAEVRAVIQAVLRPIQQQTYNISLSLGVAAFIIFLAILLAFRLFVTDPLGEIKRVSQQVIQGNLSSRAVIKTKDEFGEVMRFVNEMLSRVEGSQYALREANVMITKQKEEVEAEVRLRTRELTEEKARLISSLNGLSLGFLIAETNDAVIYCNPAVARLFGRENLVVELSDIDQKLNPTFDFAATRKKCIEQRVLVDVREIHYENKFLRLFVAPITVVESNKVIGTVAVFEDITEAKLLDYAKNSFVAIASHELRTPLTIIRGNSELLLDDIKAARPEAELIPRVNSIYGGCVRLLGIVNDFLDLTALEEKRVQFKNDPVSLPDLAEEVAKELHDRAAAKNLTITVNRPDANFPNAICDRDRSKEVFVNIIANGIQYTEKGGITISFDIHDSKVRALIKDSGIGIPEEKRKSLFKRFSAVQDKFLHSREYGSGLGLYISKLIMDSSRGDIGLVESLPGEGSTFGLVFPTTPPPPPAPPEASAPPVIAPITPSTGTPPSAPKA